MEEEEDGDGEEEKEGIFFSHSFASSSSYISTRLWKCSKEEEEAAIKEPPKQLTFVPVISETL
jgi:hypothetical protein